MVFLALSERISIATPKKQVHVLITHRTALDEAKFGKQQGHLFFVSCEF